MPHPAPLGPRPELGGGGSFLAVTPGASKIAPEAATASRDEDEPMADDDIDNARDVANYTALEAGADPPGAG